jgi:hypothetical protein
MRRLKIKSPFSPIGKPPPTGRSISSASIEKYYDYAVSKVVHAVECHRTPERQGSVCDENPQTEIEIAARGVLMSIYK